MTETPSFYCWPSKVWQEQGVGVVGAAANTGFWIPVPHSPHVIQRLQLGKSSHRLKKSQTVVSFLEVSDSFLTSDTSFKTFVFLLASVPFRRAEETVSARHRTYNSPSKQLVSDPKINVFLPWLK